MEPLWQQCIFSVFSLSWIKSAGKRKNDSSAVVHCRKFLCQVLPLLLFGLIRQTALLWNRQSGSLAAASGCWSGRSFVGLEHQLAFSLRGGNLSNFRDTVLWHEADAVTKTTTWSVQMTLLFPHSFCFSPSVSGTSLSHCLFLCVCAQFFSEYEKLLLSENYVTKRQSLKVRTARVLSVNRPHGATQLY